MIRLVRRALVGVAVLFGLLALWPVSTRYAGPIRVVAGDTIAVAGETHYLYGVTAPAPGAADALRQWIADRPAKCDIRGHDQDGKPTLICFVDGNDVAAWMVRQGWAKADPQAAFGYGDEEGEARLRRKGLWSGTGDNPGTR
jgi:endonuclease YncB( thermonuclease family)